MALVFLLASQIANLFILVNRIKYFGLLLLFLGLSSSLPLFAFETSIGGKLKLNLYDASMGTRTLVSGNTTTQTQDNSYSGMGLASYDMYISAKLSEIVSVDIRPQISVSLNATPQFGNDIGKQMNFAAMAEFTGFSKAAVKILLPEKFTLTTGLLKPKFTWESTADFYSDDQYQASVFATDTLLGNYISSGVELYKLLEFSLQEKAQPVLVPLYIYLTNGSSSLAGAANFADNNRSPMFMLHLEPQLGDFKLQGSYAFGTYDANHEKQVTRLALGLEYKGPDFQLQSEYASGLWTEGIASANEDINPSGYYIKLTYPINNWLKFIFNYAKTDHNFQNTLAPETGSESYSSISPALIITVAPQSQIHCIYEMNEWSQSSNSQSDSLTFNRAIIGWQTWF